MPNLRRTLHRIEHPGHGRYLTFSCYRRLPLFSNDRIKELFMERLAEVKRGTDFKLYAWVIMPEHVHLFLQTASWELTVKTLLNKLKARFAQRVLGRWRELDAAILRRITDSRGAARFWQPGGGYDRNIISDHEALEKIDYIHDNPRRRGLVLTPADWRWSSARRYAGDHTYGPEIDRL